MDEASPRIYGYIKAIKQIKTKKGDQMAFVTLNDYQDEIDITLFPETYARHFKDLNENAMIGVTGRFQIRDDRPPNYRRSNI